VTSLTERYLVEYAKAHKKRSSVDEDERLIKRRIMPSIGAMKVAEVTRLEIAKLHHRLRATPYEANRTVAVLSKIFNLAELWGLRPDGSNPCRHVRRYKEAKRERFLVEDELGRLGAALENMMRDGDLTPAVALAIRLLSLTGCRVSEIIGARWEQVDLEEGLMTLPDTKTGARIVPLGDAALELLKAQSRRAGFICGPDAESRLSISMMEKAWRKVCTQAGLRNARLHDLRHTVGTYTGQGGFNAFTVRDLLGHRTMAMTGRYVQRDNDPIRAAATSVSDRIAKALNGRRADAGGESTVDPVRKQKAAIP
jgi:integrase